MRVLIVDDEPEIRRLATFALREAGFAADASADGPDAFLKATRVTYDAIILDLQLPQLDGLTLLKQLRRTVGTPVLVISGRKDVEDRIEALDAGADDYLVKPIDFSELIARLRAVIRRNSGHAASTIRMGNVELDISKRMVSVAGVAVELTPREYAVLEILALHRGTLVPRTKIYDHIFEENETSLSNLLDVHMSNLRKKLGASLIRTLRGQGFIIDDKPEPAATS